MGIRITKDKLSGMMETTQPKYKLGDIVHTQLTNDENVNRNNIVLGVNADFIIGGNDPKHCKKVGDRMEYIPTDIIQYHYYLFNTVQLKEYRFVNECDIFNIGIERRTSLNGKA